ncbi:hypothetical protein JEY40_17330 [Bradyrhizobium japonicum]|uniref:hypothetical protein n=1 Tax=Bradyrhizobium TaxID=374 RepID=UPI001BA43FC1|nr:hypothetical protein [Bradyrhizobium japonicum]MBR0803446.1 hypothetical protein [Bradyrhizobium japonicum]UQD76150.1 hypothetical protein JEY40_17330 [Bradyrhizobium japonicum]
MTDLTNELAARFARQKVALLWSVCGLGNTIYAVIQILTFVNRQIEGSGAASAAFDAVALWYFGVACSIWIIPALLPLVTQRRAAILGSLLLGSFLMVTSIVGGVFDGVRDGLHVAATAIVAVALPGVYAARASWRLLRMTHAPANLVSDSDF